MFYSARIRLTALYIVIVTLVSIIFSAIIYRDVTMELQHSFEKAELRINSPGAIFIPNKATVLTLLAEDLSRSKHIVFLRLAVINGVVISLAGIAAYFLAGKTLHPIELSVEEQKRFISDASHELRTPLTAMRSEIEVALRDKSFTAKESKALLNSNLEEVDKMQKLTNYLLALNRYESGAVNLTKNKVNIAEIAKKVIERHTAAAKKKNIVLTSKLEDVFIYANETSLEELISILIDNAIKYTPNKGEVAVSIKDKKRKRIIEIKDTGIGIKASEIPYIFNRFYRADSSRSKTQAEGYGLGLSIAKSIVDLHNGQIDITSILGKGTTFTITL